MFYLPVKIDDKKPKKNGHKMERYVFDAIRWITLLCCLASGTFSSPLFGSLPRLSVNTKPCTGNSIGGRNIIGECMFNFQCQQRSGEVIGTCLDGFLFGACCRMRSNLLPNSFNRKKPHNPHADVIIDREPLLKGPIVKTKTSTVSNTEESSQDSTLNMFLQTASTMSMPTTSFKRTSGSVPSSTMNHNSQDKVNDKVVFIDSSVSLNVQTVTPSKTHSDFSTEWLVISSDNGATNKQVNAISSTKPYSYTATPSSSASSERTNTDEVKISTRPSMLRPLKETTTKNDLVTVSSVSKFPSTTPSIKLPQNSLEFAADPDLIMNVIKDLMETSELKDSNNPMMTKDSNGEQTESSVVTWTFPPQPNIPIQPTTNPNNEITMDLSSPDLSDPLAIWTTTKPPSVASTSTYLPLQTSSMTKHETTTKDYSELTTKSENLTFPEELMFWTTSAKPTSYPAETTSKSNIMGHTSHLSTMISEINPNSPMWVHPNQITKTSPFPRPHHAIQDVGNELPEDGVEDTAMTTLKPWGVSPYPVHVVNLDHLNSVDSSILKHSEDSGNPSSAENGSDSTKKPLLDVNLLMELLNLTNYDPENGIYIPAEVLKAATSTSSSSTTTTPVTTASTSTTTSTTTITTTPDYKNWEWKKTCGVPPLGRTGRIVNGKKSSFGEWPWQALVRESTWLGIFTKNKCGGVLLNSKYVLTAAHCRPGFLASLIVVLGENDVSGEYEPKPTVQKNVKRVVVHKDFVPRTFDNDLALLELDSPVTFDEHILPICLPEGDNDFVGLKGYVSGWGRLSYQGSVPDVLHTVEVPVIPNNECQDWFKEAGHAKSIKPEFICAGYKSGKKDSCEGDSGGPLSIRGADGRWVLAGIVSHGIKCARPNMPGVYMRMSYYKPWILKVMNS